MSSTYGENLHLTIFGQSHSPAIGVTVEGIPAGEKVDMDELRRFLSRRKRKRGLQTQHFWVKKSIAGLEFFVERRPENGSGKTGTAIVNR